MNNVDRIIENTASKEFWKTYPGVREKLNKEFIEFAKLHVKAALKAAAEKVELDDIGSVNPDGEWVPYYIINKESILNAYPDGNIK